MRMGISIKNIDEAYGVDLLTFASIKCQPPRASEWRIGKEVFQHTHGRDQVLIEALACYVCDSRFNCVCARVKSYLLAGQFHLSGGQRFAPKDRTTDGFMTRSAQADQTND